MLLLGLGSNLSSSFGDRFENLNLATAYLQEYKIKIIKRSSFYETPSYPDTKNPKFINIVVEVTTSLSAKNLMKELILIEEKLERKRLKKNDPRTCDIDIIDYNNEIIDFKLSNFELKIPHQSMTSRNFVLYPLKEICPNWTHPITKINIDVLIKNLKKTNNEITKISENDINSYVK